MKTRFSKILAILLPMTLACSTITLFPTAKLDPTQIIPPEILHFDSELVAFDYPAGTKIFAAGDRNFLTYPAFLHLGGSHAVGLADPRWIHTGALFSSIGIFRHTLPPGSSLEQVIQAAYTAAFTGQALPEEVPELSGPVTIDDLAALRKTYRVASGEFWYTMQDIWVEKDGSILRLSLWVETYEKTFQPLADLFLSSLDIKDNLPPFIDESMLEPTASPSPYPAALLIHYEDHLLAFNYPQGMTVFPSADTPAVFFPDIPFGSERLVGLGEPRFLVNGTYYRSIQITRRAMPPGSNFELVMWGVYQQAQAKFSQKPSSLASNGTVNAAGQTGFQWAYRVTSGEPAYELRDVWLERNGQLYIISIWTEYTTPADFWAFQSAAQALLDSLKIK